MASRFHLSEIDILGITYTIKCCKFNETEILKNNNFEGFCGFDSKTILLADLQEEPYNFRTTEERQFHENHTLRHEITHAFLMESGLYGSSLILNENAWATNEEMVDWFAIQSPKIYKVFQELDIL